MLPLGVGSVNLYEALGVPVGASVDQIRHAYLEAARVHHPDFHLAEPEAAQAEHARRMQLVNEAWAVLGQRESRERYDLSLRMPAPPPTERVRPAREPTVPAGKGWTPRRDDDGWQRDFRGWAEDGDELPPDEPGPGRPGLQGLRAVIPVALFALAVGSVFLGAVLGARGLLALGFAALAASAALFVMLPVIEMARGRDRD
ncbi:MAG: J domain-containing protein [Acidimicrobiales bacterium]